MTEAKSVSLSFPGFLDAGDLDGNEVTMTIKLVREPGDQDKGLDGQPIDKPIVAFEKRRKEWVLNKTNAKTIRDDLGYGNKYEKWKGRKIVLFPTTCRSFGETVACIRVKVVDPETGKEPDLF